MLRITDIVRLLKSRGGLQSYDLTIAGSGAATAANYTVPLASTVNNQRSKVIVSVIVRHKKYLRFTHLRFEPLTKVTIEPLSGKTGSVTKKFI